jgi:hypothetical protein
VVRPGRRNGGTTLVFTLSQRTLLKITIFRVYPSCKRVGSFTVRGRPGVNRIRFAGRLRGRPLAEGGYRLVIRARGFRRDVAAIPIVIVRGKTNSLELRKARRRSVCTDRVAYLAAGADPSDRSTDDAGGLGVFSAVKHRVKDRLSEAAGAVAHTAKGISDRVERVVAGDRFDKPIVLTIVGLMTLFIAFLGALVLAHVVRAIADDRG